MYIHIIFVVSIVLLILKSFLKSIVIMLQNSVDSICIAENYRKKSIPSIGGIVFIPLLMTALFLLSTIMPVIDEKCILFMLIVCCIGFIGLLDDLAGEKNTKGIKNHIAETLGGRLTTGFLKAEVGFILAFIVSLRISLDVLDLIINSFVISLSANTINLLDLRPGRAVKSFLIASLILILSNVSKIYEFLPLVIIHAISWLYMPYDLKEECMLGDTGSNILGITLGYYTALMQSKNGKLIILVILVVINAISEKISITEIIKKNRFLSYLDNLGRS